MVERDPFAPAPPEREGPAPIVAVVPAAGSGSRVGGERPKQYLTLGDETLLERTMQALFAVPAVSSAVIAIGGDDEIFATLPLADDPRIATVIGGETRAHSVAAALTKVRAEHGDDAWALVHDAARPLIARADIERLIEAVRQAVPDASDDPLGPPTAAPVPASGSEAIVGGILAVRVSDTLKRERGGARWSELFEADDAALEIDATLERDGLWQAQTPQLFRAGPLADALRMAIAARAAITDEASAFERQGKRCLLIEASSPNIKVTRPDDLELVRALFERRGEAGTL